MRISDWSSDVCSSDLEVVALVSARAKRGELPLAERRIVMDRNTDVFPVPAGLRMEPAELGGLKAERSEEHTSELQSLMRISYAVFCLKKKKTNTIDQHTLPSKQKL